MKQILTVVGILFSVLAYPQGTRFEGIYTNGESYVKFWADTLEFKLCKNGCDGWYCNRGLGKYSLTDSMIIINTTSPNRIGFSRYYQKGNIHQGKNITFVFYDDLGRTHDSVFFEVYGQKYFRSYRVFEGKVTIDLSQIRKPEEIKIRGWQDGQCCHYSIPFTNILTDLVEVYLPKYSHFEDREVKFDYKLIQDSLNVRWSTVGYQPPSFPLKTKIRFACWCFSHSWPWNYGKCELKRISVHSNDYFKLIKN